MHTYNVNSERVR